MNSVSRIWVMKGQFVHYILSSVVPVIFSYLDLFTKLIQEIIDLFTSIFQLGSFINIMQLVGGGGGIIFHFFTILVHFVVIN